MLVQACIVEVGMIIQGRDPHIWNINNISNRRATQRGAHQFAAQRQLLLICMQLSATAINRCPYHPQHTYLWLLIGMPTPSP